MSINLGYWTPVYGGFLRNVTDEGRMAATWDHIRDVSVRADRLGFHTTLVPELYLNDRKGVEAPSLEAWSLSAAILAATDRLRVMTAVRPGFHLPAVLAKTVSTLDSIAPGRVSLNVVAAWWAEEARQFGGNFPAHDERYTQAKEFVDVLNGLWRETPFSYTGATTRSRARSSSRSRPRTPSSSPAVRASPDARPSPTSPTRTSCTAARLTRRAAMSQI